MKRPDLLGGVVTAFIIAAIAAVAFAALRPVLGITTALETVITMTSGCYVVTTLVVAGTRAGRLVVPVIWIAGALAAWSLPVGPAGFAGIHAALSWLVRCWSIQRGMLAAVADGAFTVIGACAAVVAAYHSHNVFLAVWTFYLSQAIAAAIPPATGANRDAARSRFTEARRTAEAALRRLPD